MFRLIGFLAVIMVGIHGYFHVTYSTMDPCEAAIERMIKDAADGAPILFLGKKLSGVTGFNPADALRKEGLSTCYAVALLGGE